MIQATLSAECPEPGCPRVCPLKLSGPWSRDEYEIITGFCEDHGEFEVWRTRKADDKESSGELEDLARVTLEFRAFHEARRQR